MLLESACIDPITRIQFQTVASNIIGCFEKDWDDQGLARGCPDFLYTVLTFAVVSLLKASEWFVALEGVC